MVSFFSYSHLLYNCKPIELSYSMGSHTSAELKVRPVHANEWQRQNEWGSEIKWKQKSNEKSTKQFHLIGIWLRKIKVDGNHRICHWQEVVEHSEFLAFWWKHFAVLLLIIALIVEPTTIIVTAHLDVSKFRSDAIVFIAVNQLKGKRVFPFKSHRLHRRKNDQSIDRKMITIENVAYIVSFECCAVCSIW